MESNKRKWTLLDGKTRDASVGPWVAGENVAQFLDFCNKHGHQTREHSDPFVNGYQVHHKGHWMAVIWNKSFGRYTADRRLSLLVQSFASDNAQITL